MALKKHEIIAAVIEKRGKITEVARALGCSTRAIYDHRDKDPEIAEAIADSRLCHDVELLDTAESKLLEHVEAGNWWAIKYVL